MKYMKRFYRLKNSCREELLLEFHELFQTDIFYKNSYFCGNLLKRSGEHAIIVSYI